MKKISDKVASERSEHTPTPWKVEKSETYSLSEHGKSFNYSLVSESDFERIAIVGKHKEANAAFIVRAVNAHGELISLLKEIHILHRELNVSEHLDNRIQQAITKSEETLK